MGSLSYDGPVTENTRKCENDRKSGSSGLDFALESGWISLWNLANNWSEKWLGPGPGAPATFPASFWFDPRAESGPDEPFVRSISRFSDFTDARH
jgi:hypothetical protein